MTRARVAPWEALPDEAAALVPHLPAVAEEIVDAVRTEVPDYARPLEGEFGRRVRAGAHAALDQFVAMARAPGAGRAAGRSVYVELGRYEQREGRSLESLLAAYRVGARVAWRRLAALGLAAGLAPETLVTLAEAIFAYVDQLSAESAEGYAAEQAERAGEAGRRRAALMVLLLAVPPADATALAEAAEAAHWRVPATLAVAAWAHGSVPLPAGALAAPHDGLVVAVVPDPDGPGRVAELRRAFRGTAAGLGPAVDPPHAEYSLRRAVAALGLARDGLVVAAERRLALLLRADPALIEEIAQQRLAPLAGETPRSRERLQSTLLAWLRHDGDVAAAAAELSVHVQTVRYRLARARALLGAALDEPDARFELEAALRAREIGASA